MQTVSDWDRPYFVTRGMVWRRIAIAEHNKERVANPGIPVAIPHLSAEPLSARKAARLMNLGHIAPRIVGPVRTALGQHPAAAPGAAEARVLLTELEALI